ncbi:MAG: HAD-IA family hydrolase [Actinomycetota bacterium]
MSQPDAVLLDLYDTLVWSDWWGWQERLAGELGVTHEAVGRAFDLTRPARSTGAYTDADDDLASVIRAAGLEPVPALVRHLRELEHAHIEEGGVRLYDDALPVVRELRARGVKTALVSNCSHNTRPLIERLGLDDEFDAVILSVEVRAMKPDPAIYRITLDRLGVTDPTRAVFVDDQTAYCDGASEVGMWTYLILRPEEAAEGRPANVEAYRTIDTLTSLL